MTCGDFMRELGMYSGPVKQFIYQKIPGGGSYNPSIGGMGPSYSVPEFELKTAIANWNSKDYVAVIKGPTTVSFETTSDSSHKNDVLKVIPGTIVAVIGTV